MQLPLLSIIIFIPLAAGIAILFLPAERKDLIRGTAVGAAIIDLVVSVVVYFSYNVAQAGYQFIEKVPWLPALGISYYVGVDGSACRWC